MKRFTTLDSDILKENTLLTEKLSLKVEKAQENLNRVNEVLNILKEEYTKQPNNLTIVNEVEHINAELTKILDDLGLNKEYAMGAKNPNEPEQMIPADPNSEIQ